MGDEAYLDWINGYCVRFLQENGRTEERVAGEEKFCETFGGYTVNLIRGTGIATAEKRIHLIHETVLTADYVDDRITKQPMESINPLDRKVLHLYRLTPYSDLRCELGWQMDPHIELFESGLTLRLEPYHLANGEFRNPQYRFLRDFIECVLRSPES